MNTHQKYFAFVAIIVAFAPVLVFGSTTNGTIQNGYAWAERAGWVNFATTNGAVLVTDSAISGYAWDANYGWINLAPANSGVVNDGSGNLSGYAWSASGGYINFSGVTINSSGVFSGTASGTKYGRLTFDCTNCSVTTDWRPASVRSGSGNSNNSNSTGTTSAPIISSSGNTKMVFYKRSDVPAQTGTSTQAMWRTPFKQTLLPGMTNADVKKLQIFLNDQGFIVSKMGPGSKGNETLFYGAGTKAAVIAFQNFYRDDILRPQGLKIGNGYFGPGSLKKANIILSH